MKKSLKFTPDKTFKLLWKVTVYIVFGIILGIALGFVFGMMISCNWRIQPAQGALIMSPWLKLRRTFN